MSEIIPVQKIEKRIYLLRDQKIMLDIDLAELYGVKTKALVQAVKRNIERFPKDFMFRLINQEVTILRSQIVTSSWGGRRYLPYAFTEHGVAMLSSILNSKQAILVNVQIMRTFGKLREIMTTHKDLAKKLAGLEAKYDHQFKIVFDAIRALMKPEPSSARKIGF